MVIAAVFMMDRNDWYTFSTLVPSGAHAKFLSRYSERWADGIILENYPYSLTDREEKSVYTVNALRFQCFESRDDIIDNLPFYVEVERGLYLVEGEWLTLIQLLSR